MTLHASMSTKHLYWATMQMQAFLTAKNIFAVRKNVISAQKCCIDTCVYHHSVYMDVFLALCLFIYYRPRHNVAIFELDSRQHFVLQLNRQGRPPP